MDEGKISELERWIYSNDILETQLEADDFLDLISIDFSKSSARFLAAEIFRKNISADEFLTWKISQILERVINRVDGVHSEILEIYQLYCSGYSFLGKLGMDYGLSIAAPSPLYDKWGDLALSDQIRRLDGFYPEIVAHAQRALDCIQQGEIEFSGNEIDNLLHPLPPEPKFLDRRSDENKKAMSVNVI
ncbi:MAG: hypothetical protein AAGH90_04765 [Pseudomonadota bacterium]